MANTDIFIGVILSVLGSICINLGNNLMSLGHRQDHEDDEQAAHERKSHEKVERLMRAGNGNMAEAKIVMQLTKDAHSLAKAAGRRMTMTMEYTTIKIRNNVTSPRSRVGPEGKALDRSATSPSLSQGLSFGWSGRFRHSDIEEDPAEAKGEEDAKDEEAAAPKPPAVRRTSTFMGDEFHAQIHQGKRRSLSKAKSGRGKDGKAAEGGEDGEDGGEPEKKGHAWLIGTCIFVCGSLFNFVSFGYAPQSMLASLESSQFVANVIFSKIILGAEITRNQIIGTVLLVGGCITVVMSSSHETTEYTAEGLMELYTRVPYIVFLCLVAVTLPTVRVIYNMYDKRLEDGDPLPHSSAVLPITYCIFSAIVGTQQFLFAKCLSELLRLTVEGENQLVKPFTYFCLVMWIGTATYWVYRMNDALKRFPGAFIIPVLQVHFTMIAIVSGGIYFEELIGLPGLCCPGYTGFFLGVFVVFLGVYMLAPPDHDKHAEAHKATAETNKRRASCKLSPAEMHAMLEEPGAAPP